MTRPKTYAQSALFRDIRKYLVTPPNMVREYITYDAATGEIAYRDVELQGDGRDRWRKIRNARTAGGDLSPNPNGYVIVSINGLRFAAHQAAFAYEYGFWPAERGQSVDHINRDRSDNRMCNLRLANPTLQARNRSTDKKVSGVGWSKAAGKWRAQIGINGKKVYLGQFDTEAEAIRVRLVAESQLPGFPNSTDHVTDDSGFQKPPRKRRTAQTHRLDGCDLSDLGDGYHGDGDGLFLRVKGEARSWVFRYTIKGKKREKAIGPERWVSLAEARAAADRLRVQP